MLDKRAWWERWEPCDKIHTWVWKYRSVDQSENPSKEDLTYSVEAVKRDKITKTAGMRNGCQPCNLHTVITRPRMKVKTESCRWVKKESSGIQHSPLCPTHIYSLPHLPSFTYSKRLNVHEVLKVKNKSNFWFQRNLTKCQQTLVCTFVTQIISGYPLVHSTEAQNLQTQ